LLTFTKINKHDPSLLLTKILSMYCKLLFLLNFYVLGKIILQVIYLIYLYLYQIRYLSNFLSKLTGYLYKCVRINILFICNVFAIWGILSLIKKCIIKGKGKGKWYVINNLFGAFVLLLSLNRWW
jgi:hypothetical protein